MSDRNSQRRNYRMNLDPPEVGILYLAEAGDVSGTNPAPAPKKLFVDLINRSPEGVGIQAEKKIEPATDIYLRAFNKAEKTWDLFEGETKWILPGLKKGLRHKLGAELKPTRDNNELCKELDCPDKKMPVASEVGPDRPGRPVLLSCQVRPLSRLTWTPYLSSVHAIRNSIHRGWNDIWPWYWNLKLPQSWC